MKNKSESQRHKPQEKMEKRRSETDDKRDKVNEKG